MLIGGCWVDSSNKETMNIVDPATGELIDTVPKASEEDIKLALDSVQVGREAMRSLPAHERSKILKKAAKLIEEDHEELSLLLSRENGKPIRQTREEISATVRLFIGFAEEATRLEGTTVPMDSVPGMENSIALTIRQPVGVVAAIVPFNYPAELYAHKTPAAIAAGNAVITKPPSACPLTVIRLGAYLEEAGLPRNAQQIVTGSGAMIGNILAAAPGIQLITLTGSVAVGQQVAQLAASNMKKVLLELGGNDATIICKDADLELAAEGIILGRLARGNGQICCAVKRVLVQRTVMDEFVGILIRKTKNLVVGHQVEEKTDVGPLITESAAKKVESLIMDAKQKGAAILHGGSRNGAFIEPTIISGIDPEIEIFAEETFGPVVPVVPFDSIDEAIALANDSPYGLQSAVFTRDLNTAMDTAYRLDAGGVVINWGSAVRAENLPFGGVKMSGTGRECIKETLMEMTEQKAIIIKDSLSIYS